MRATFFSKALNFFDSPTRSARSRMVIESYGSNAGGGVRTPEAAAARPVEPGAGALRGPFLRRAVRLPTAAPLVAVLLDLAGEVLGHQVDRMPHVGGALARAQRHPLQVQGRLGDLRLANGRVALLAQFELELRERGDLPRHLVELLVHP